MGTGGMGTGAVPHCWCGPYPCTPYPLCPYYPCAPYPCTPCAPIAHRPHTPCTPYPMYTIVPCAIWVMGQWGTGGMGYRGYGAMGNWDIFVHSIITTGWIVTKLFTGHRYWCILSKYRAIFPRWLELKHISMDFKFCLLSAGRSDGHSSETDQEKNFWIFLIPS